MFVAVVPVERTCVQNTGRIPIGTATKATMLPFGVVSVTSPLVPMYKARACDGNTVALLGVTAIALTAGMISEIEDIEF